MLIPLLYNYKKCNMIDFTEIPSANTGNGDQDTFELFARDFFKNLGYEIIEEPARGADNGRDLIIGEIFESNLTKQTEVKRWLVSCKHYAHSGNSVTGKDEQDIKDRIMAHRCNGFIGFYSTVPNESLKFKLSNVESVIFDKQKIEEFLKKEKSLAITFGSYFPKSYKNYLDTEVSFKPLEIFDEYFLNHPIYKDCIIFKKGFKSNNLYNGFIVSDTFEAFMKFLGYSIEIVKFVKDFNEVGRAILLAQLNEMINDDEIIDRDYNKIHDKKVRQMVYEIDNMKKDSEEEISRMMQQIIINIKLPKKIRVLSSGISSNRSHSFGIYFLTNDIIYMNIVEYRHTRNIFNTIKNKYFKR